MMNIMEIMKEAIEVSFNLQQRIKREERINKIYELIKKRKKFNESTPFSKNIDQRIYLHAMDLNLEDKAEIRHQTGYMLI